MIKLAELAEGTGGVLGCVLFVVYTVLLYHVRTGNKNKWITFMVLLLMTSSVGMVMIGWGGYHLNVMHDGTMCNVLFLGIGLALDQMPFCVAHYLMAVKYSNLARVVPDVLSGRPEQPLT